MRLSWAVTLGAVLTWAALSAVSRVLLLRLELDPWAFSFIQLCAGGTVLLVVSGRGPVDFTSFTRPATWILGMLRVLSAALYTAVLAWVSVLEAGILGAISVPMIAIAVWAVFGRAPARGEWLGHLIMLAAIAMLVAGLDAGPDAGRDEGLRYAATSLMLLNALCLVAIAILAERHPDNVSDRPGVRLRFTGAVLLATAGFFLLLRLIQGDAGVGWPGAAGTSAPGGGAAWSGPLLISGIAVGVFLRAPSMVLAFWSIRLVGAQNYMAAVAFLPILGTGFEQTFFALGFIDVSRFSAGTLLLGLGVVAGTLVVLATRLWPKWSANSRIAPALVPPFSSPRKRDLPSPRSALGSPARPKGD